MTRVVIDTNVLIRYLIKPGVVLDEFPSLAGAQPGIPSLLQRLWDEYLVQTNLV